MTKQEKEFRKYCDKELQSIYSKINQEEKEFLSYLVMQFNKICERNDKAIEYIKPRFMNVVDNDKRYFADDYIQELYEILKGDSND